MRETLLKTLKEVAASVIDPGVRPTAKPTFGRGDAPTCCHRLRRGDAAHEATKPRSRRRSARRSDRWRRRARLEPAQQTGRQDARP
jgi:hypothetical protein